MPILRNLSIQFCIAIISLHAFLMLSIPFKSSSQEQLPNNKKVIDKLAVSQWQYLSPGMSLSDDGKYAGYSIQNSPIEGQQTFIIAETSGKWKLRYPNTSNPSLSFAKDNQLAIFLKNTDTLTLINLIDQKINLLPNVLSFRVSENGDWLIYQKSDSLKRLFIENLRTERTEVISGIEKYQFLNSSDLILQSKIENSEMNTHSLNVIHLSNPKEKVNWNGQLIKSIVVDNYKNGFAFITESSLNKSPAEIWIYRNSSKNFEKLYQHTNKDFALAGINSLSLSQNQILISIEKKITKAITEPVNADVTIWSYLEKEIPLRKEATKNSRQRFQLYINLLSGNTYHLENDSEKIITMSAYNALIRTQNTIRNRYDDVNERERYNYYIFNFSNGRRTEIHFPENMPNSPVISPNGKHMIYFDAKEQNYYSINLELSTTLCLTRQIKTKWHLLDFEYPTKFPPTYEVAGWVDNGQSVLLYDQYNIWMISLTNNTTPKQLTQSDNDSICYRFPGRYNSFTTGETVVTVAFDESSKKNGFYEVTINKNGSCKKLIMDDATFYAPTHFTGFTPLKAKKSNAYLIRKETSTESQNLYFTRDFSHLIKLTDLQPEKEYSWLQSKLLKWQTKEGKEIAGILYVPFNFDSTHKYPTIIHIYEKMTDQLNVYHKPELMIGPIDIPWMVSRGYVIFTPDISYKEGNSGENSFYSVNSSIQYLSSQPWVGKLGLQGHSFGGFETNYILTKTNAFSAACTSAGVSNSISDYGSVLSSGSTRQKQHEEGQYRMGGTLWAKKKEYLDHSPVFNADKITSPLLLLNNKDDAAVPYTQGIELFMALKRLNKPVWLLQYANETHCLLQEKNQQDYSTRLTDFFDHYLKNEPPPLWMLGK